MTDDKGQLPTIGSTAEVDFLDFNIFDVPAKIDTGADRSSVWATDIKELEDGTLEFVLLDDEHELYTGKKITVRSPKTSVIRNSTGDVQVRYRVKLKIKLEDRSIKTYFTLSDRSKNSYPVLIGRKTLHNRFIVDVKKNKPEKKETLSSELSKGIEPADEKLNIAVLSKGPGNYSTKRLVQTLRLRGHNTRIINYSECYVDIEQDNLEVRFQGEPVDIPDAIIPRISSKVTRYGSAIVRQFEMMGVYTTARSIAIERSRNKLRSLQLLSKSEVGIPKTIFSRETDAVEDLIEQIGAPFLIKVAKGTHGRGVVLVESRRAAKSVIQAFYVENVSILLQEFIEEASGEDIRAFIVGGKVVAAMQRKSLGDDFRSNLHMGGSAEEVKLTAEEKRNAVKAAKAMGLDICGVDLIRSKRGPLVLEVNSSPGLRGIEQATKKDIALEIVKYVEANARKKQMKDKVGA